MDRRYQVALGDKFDANLLARIDDVLHGENLIQTILHVHLLVEKALTLKIKEKLTRPDVLDGGKFARWSFGQKVSIYIGLYDPSSEAEQLLIGLNRLRNLLAHSLIDESAAVADCLPWMGTQLPQPDPMGQIWVTALYLFFELGAVSSIEVLTQSHEDT